MDVVAAGEHWRLSTARGPVHVWRPRGGGGEGVVVYVHGYGDTADSAWANHRLADQFRASGRNAVFIVPGAPSARGESVTWPDLEALLQEVERGTGLFLARAVTGVGHSAGFETLAKWLGNPALDEVVLLDALYGFAAAFRDWANQPGHRFVNVVTASGPPRANSEQIVNQLHDVLRLQGVPAALDSIAQTAKALYIVATQNHMGLVTSGAVIPVLLRSSSPAVGVAGAVLAGVAAVAIWHAIR
jgi:hypothetical protein